MNVEDELPGLVSAYAEAMPLRGQKIALARQNVANLKKRIEALTVAIQDLENGRDEDAFDAEALRQKAELEKAIRQAMSNREIFEARIAVLENQPHT